MFGIVCLYLYAGYAERPGPGRYFLVLLTLILSLMAKPMLVSLPFVMLLADYWPMRRFASDDGASGHSACEKTFLMLVREKIPLFLIVAASCAITIYAQHKGDAIRSLEVSPFTLRVANAIVSYKDYLHKTFWPLDLAVLYPYPESLHTWNVLGSAGLLTVISIIVIRDRQRYPSLLVGWLWYVGTLVPVIGLVRVGLQGMADRYTYIPLIGIFLMVVWGAAELTVGWAHRRTLLVSLAVVSLGLSALFTWRQVSWWKDNVTLYKHTLAVTSNNYIIQNNLGYALDSKGRIDEAIAHYSEAVRIAPRYAKARLNMAITLRKAGRLEESLVHAVEAIKLGPDSAPAYNELGAILLMMGRYDEATANLKKALTINPELADAHYNLGLALGNRGRSVEAVAQYAEALRIKPNDVDCLYNLGIEYARMGKYGEAAEYFRTVLLLKPDKEMESLARDGLARIEK